MKVAVGSLNEVKLNAVSKALQEMGIDAIVIPVDVESGVHEIPLNDEIFEGARNRALSAKKRVPADLYIGLESGLVKMYGKTFMVSVAAVLKGESIHYGLSPGFEIPERWAVKIERDRSSFFEFMEEKGGRDLGKRGGLVSVLTSNVITRTEFCKLAVIMAVSKALNEKW
ncbi:DUF84 family protein [Ignicoccus islandicus]|nr:inosine/xanthosine triphosphatase [Ignicoccus islandicus]